MSNFDKNQPVWRKSSRSGPSPTGNCVEVAVAGDAVLVRDSKNPEDGHLRFSAPAWSTFVSTLGRAGLEEG